MSASLGTNEHSKDQESFRPASCDAHLSLFPRTDVKTPVPDAVFIPDGEGAEGTPVALRKAWEDNGWVKGTQEWLMGTWKLEGI